jgi:hypothetical protein
VPKATCPGCKRPVALLKSARCVYCGTALGGQGAAPAPASKLPAEVLIALEPRQRDTARGSVWFRRILALAGAGLLTALVMGPCMKA